MRRRVRVFWWDVRVGWHYGFPLCCTLRFALGRGDQAVRRGIRGHHENPHVPCRIFHFGTPYYEVCALHQPQVTGDCYGD